MKKWLQIARYRLGQVRQQLGFVTPLATEEYSEVERWLPTPALELFKTMSPADQRHSLRVCRGLQSAGCEDEDMLAAALLHDVGKAQGRAPFWTRPAIVVGKGLAPGLLKRLVVDPRLYGHAVGADKSALGTVNRPLRFTTEFICQFAIHCVPIAWRRSLSYAWYHAEVGAELAAAAGLSERAVLYIRTHHQPKGPAARLHEIDEVS